jgi:hypothetical protein
MTLTTEYKISFSGKNGTSTITKGYIYNNSSQSSDACH